MNVEADSSRIASLIESSQLSEALWVIRDALARSPGDRSLLKLAAKLAAVAESRAMDLSYNKATDGSHKAGELEEIAKHAKEYAKC
jgi:hypothetical protein